MFELVIAQEKHIDFRFENRIVFRDIGVLFDTTDEPPAGISTIVSRVSAEVQ